MLRCVQVDALPFLTCTWMRAGSVFQRPLRNNETLDTSRTSHSLSSFSRCNEAWIEAILFWSAFFNSFDLFWYSSSVNCCTGRRVSASTSCSSSPLSNACPARSERARTALSSPRVHSVRYSRYRLLNDLECMSPSAIPNFGSPFSGSSNSLGQCRELSPQHLIFAVYSNFVKR